MFGAPNEMSYHDDISTLPERSTTGFEIGRQTVRGGVVYVIDGGEGRIKIGASSHPKTRITTVLSTGGVCKAKIAITATITNYFFIEAEFKREFSDRKVAGEWFLVGFDDAVDFVRSYSWEYDTIEAAANDAYKTTQGNKRFVEKLEEMYHIDDYKKSGEYVSDGIRNMGESLERALDLIDRLTETCDKYKEICAAYKLMRENQQPIIIIRKAPFVRPSLKRRNRP